MVIVNLHWGDENVTQRGSFQLGLAQDADPPRDITAIVDQHVHVVQPIRTLNGKLVVFGEGNLISNETSACCPAGTAWRTDPADAALRASYDRTVAAAGRGPQISRSQTACHKRDMPGRTFGVA